MKIQVRFTSNPHDRYTCCAETIYNGEPVFGIGETWQLAEQNLVSKIQAMMSMNPLPNSTLIEVTTPPSSVTSASASTKKGLGTIGLVPSYFQDPAPNPALIDMFTNAHLKGVRLSITWERLFKDGYGTFNWTFMDSIFDAAEANNKIVYVQLEPGINAHPDFFNLPGAKFIQVNGTGDKYTVPFDPVFLSEWGTIVNTVATRYKHRSSLRFVKAQGCGKASESFWAIKQAEWDMADQLASDLDYDNKWLALFDGARQLIDMHCQAWSPIKVQQITGSPYGLLTTTPVITTDGIVTDSTSMLQAYFNYGNRLYRGQFAACAHNLNKNSPHAGDIAQTAITANSPLCIAAGYQFGNSPNSVADFDTAWQLGVSFGAHEIEVFNDNTTSDYYASLDACNLALKA